MKNRANFEDGFGALLVAFGRDRSGVFAIIFGLVLVPLFGMSGAAIDYATTISARDKMKVIVDYAVIAGVEKKVSDGMGDAELIAFVKKMIVDRASQISGLTLDTVTLNVANSAGNASHVSVVVEGRIATNFIGIIGIDEMPFSLTNAATASREERVLDLVMCIDATGSMQGTINTARSHALNLDTNLKAELATRGLEIDSIRARVVFYRDFGGPYRYGWITTTVAGYGYKYVSGYGWKWAYWTGAHLTQGYGYEPADTPTMAGSVFYDLKTDKSAFRTFLYSEDAFGGWNWDEGGLECVNEAMGSRWRQAGSSGEIVMPVIVIWTDAPADLLGNTDNINGGVNAEWIDNEKYECAKVGSFTPADYACHNWGSATRHGYPTDMPRTLADMTAKWNDNDVVPQDERQIILFGPLSTGWSQISGLTGFQNAGSISTGTAHFVTALADAIAAGGISPPRLTR